MSKKVRRINHYNSKQKILLGEEGDFSFSACLARAFASATNMVATSLDSERTIQSWNVEIIICLLTQILFADSDIAETWETKYWSSTAHLEYLMFNFSWSERVWHEWTSISNWHEIWCYNFQLSSCGSLQWLAWPRQCTYQSCDRDEIYMYRS